ncbi:hypothetical protein [Marinobacterium rhizophilum]|uniref:hypothetical protein n=1 Tax=Marinobacterium rhizophilum TaxID=420402 RepID=UPI00036D8962|nr:hypothetical protein [Marinobacterium rhizophilum]
MALAIGLCLPLAYAHASTPVEFDPDGQGGGGAFTIGSLDWLPGSTVIKDEIPLEDDSTVSAQAYAHSALAAAVDPDGIVINPPGLNVSYEITAFLANGVEITTNLDGTVVLLALDPANGDNSFEMYYDDNPNANPLGGTGFRDGHLILSGQLTALSGNFTASNQDSPFEDLDEFGANNWPGTQTISGQGSQQLAVLVQSVDKDFFPSGVDLGTILPFNNSQVVSFKQTNPSMNFSLNPGGGALDPVDTGVVNGLTGPDLLLQIDPNNAFEFIPPELACRVTGGGNDTAGIFENGAAGWDGTVAEGLITPTVTNGNGRGKKTQQLNGNGELEPYRYTMGGQAGANTAQQPQPKGEWTHSNHNSPNSLKFTFHAGTASAPDGTEIDEIICTDAGFCFPARPAPNKQIDFVGIGTFKNLSWKNPEVTHSVGVVDAAFYDIQPEPVGNKPGQDPATYHWFQVHIEDLGEPGNKAEDGAVCPEKGSGNDPFADPPVTDNVADCGCGDFYHIRIYEGVVPTFNADGEVTNINKDDLIYEVYGYINGGNFQIHPLTGFDLK